MAESILKTVSRANVLRQVFLAVLVLLCLTLIAPCVEAADSETAGDSGTATESAPEEAGEEEEFDVFSSAPAEDEDTSDPNVMEMDTMVVTGSRTGTDAPEKMAVPVQVVTSEELEEIGAVTLDQALEVIQGVELIDCPDMNATPGVKTLRMRGMDANHVLVLINGRRQAGTRPDKDGFAFTDISGINISDIERIEVLRDGASAQYGADAVAGVINIVLRKHNPRLTVSTQHGISSRGDGEESQAEISTGTPVGDIAFLNISVNSRKTAHYDRTPDNPRWSSPEVDQKGGTIKGSVELTEQQALDAELRFNRTDSVMRIGTSGDTNKDRISEKKDYYGGLTYEGDFDFLRFEYGLGTGTSDTEYRQSEDPTYNGDLTSSTQEAYLHVDWKIASWLDFFVGTSYNRENVDAPYRDFVENREVYALFAETSITLFESLTVSLSGRLEEYSDFGTNFAPKISTRYEWSKNLAFRASASHSYQVPTLYQLHDNFEGAMGWNDIYGNPDLDPAEGVNINGGVVWTPFGADSLLLTADVYQNKIDNMIETDMYEESTATTNAKTTYVNLDGTSTFRGVEVSAGLPLPYGFDFDVTANYLKAKGPDGEDLTNRPRSRLNLTLSYNYDNRLTANVRYVYRGKYLSDTSPAEKIDPFDYFNAQVNYILLKGVTFFAGARNIFDEHPPVDYEDFEGGHRESMLDSPMGAYYYAGWRVSF